MSYQNLIHAVKPIRMYAQVNVRRETQRAIAPTIGMSTCASITYKSYNYVRLLMNIDWRQSFIRIITNHNEVIHNRKIKETKEITHYYGLKIRQMSARGKRACYLLSSIAFVHVRIQLHRQSTIISFSIVRYCISIMFVSSRRHGHNHQLTSLCMFDMVTIKNHYKRGNRE